MTNLYFEKSDNSPSFWQRIVSAFMSIVILAHIFIPSIATAAECIKTASICVEGSETRLIDDVPVTKDCWRYEDTYSCTTAVAGQKACDPLANKSGCGQTFSNCLQKGLNGECIRFTRDYTCSSDLKKDYSGSLPVGITELDPTHEISKTWDESDCTNKTANLTACSNTNTTCSASAETREINGVSITEPCWENTKEYQCLSGQNQTVCDAATDANCRQTSVTCQNMVNGVCQTSSTKFQCLVRAGTTTPSDTCKDQDFAKVMTGLEGSREFARYFDTNSMTFFNGTDSRCSIKLGGSLGGNCCRTAESADKWKDAAISAAASYGVNAVIAPAVSSYTYSIIVTQSSSLVASMTTAAVSAAGVNMAGTATIVTAPSVGTAGVGITATGSGQLAFAINPAMMAIAIAIMLVQMWLQCSPDEQKVALRKKAGLCTYVGSYCSSKFLGACVEKSQTYCCYVSKLARIISEGGHAQLKKSYGSPESPDCSGFNQNEMSQLDLSKIDMSEFFNELQYKTLDSASTIKNANTATQQIFQGGTGGYYNQ